MSHPIDSSAPWHATRWPVRSLALASAGALVIGATLSVAPVRGQTGEAGRPIHVLFLGQDEGAMHSSARAFAVAAPRLARHGIQLTHVNTPEQALVPETLAYYDAILIYGDHRTLTNAEENALTTFVSSGKGLVAIHSAAAMFPASARYAALIGGTAADEGAPVPMTVSVTTAASPITQGLSAITSVDAPFGRMPAGAAGRTVLMERETATGREPYAWTQIDGKGRAFVTALGHDDRTWSNDAFQTLVERAIVWSVDADTQAAYRQLKMPEVAYLDGYNVPNYENRDPAPKYQLPFSPADEQKFLQVPPEFSVQLFASEPDIVKPITMAFDERGRLWVIEAMDYPNDVYNGGEGDDRIKICEDTDGDGRADKFTVFADHINLGTSLTFANGGVIVAAAPYFLFLKDTNGDDRADVRQILSNGWGLRDTHAGPSNLQYGPDNEVWGVVGYSGFDGQMNGKPLQFTQGAYHFKPDGSDFEYLTTSTNNTWGLGFNETFDVFGSTANGDPSWYMGIPNRYFDGISGLPGNGPNGRGASIGYQSLAQFTAVHNTTPYIRQVDNQGSFTAGAGHMFYTARAFPKDYWNRVAFISEPTAHVTAQGIVESEGAGYVTRDGWNLVSSAEEWFAPVAAMVGPDGAVWVDDWNNFIAQHNPTPTGFSAGRGAAYETSMRDHLRGRIYRIVYKNAPPQKKRSLSRTDTAGLLDALGSDNMFWRLQAQRLIVERGQKDLVPNLIAMVNQRTVDAIGTSGGAFNALWTLKGLGALDAAGTDAYRAAVGALKHPAAGVRKAAVMVLPHTEAAASAILGAGLQADPDLHTRLAATLVLADMPAAAEIGQAVYKASQIAENYSDPWLSRALYVAGTRERDSFLAAYRADPKALPFTALPVPLRIGNLRPDWRAPSAQDLSADWKDMTVPGNWEAHGLPNFDGVVWFTRTIDIAPGTTASNISLGPVRNTADVWLNGIPLAAAFAAGAGRGPAGAPPATSPPAGRGVSAPEAGPLRPTAAAITTTLMYPVPANTLRAGRNVITVRVQNTRADGGFVGTADAMYLESGTGRTPLAGTWKYRVERQANTGALYSKPGELAAHVAFVAAGGADSAAGAALPVVTAAPDTVLQLGVVPSEMKYSSTELTAQAGQLVEIHYTNSDQVQHNFVLGAPGSLARIGGAAEQFAQSPGAMAQSYVPDSSDILFHTNLLAAGETVAFQFRAPEQPGDYPYMCTFPGHWRLMNGVLHVVAPFGRGRGAGGRAAGPGAAGANGAGANAGGRANGQPAAPARGVN